MGETPKDSLSLSSETVQRIRRAAQRRGVSVDQFLQALLRQGDPPAEGVSPEAEGREVEEAFLDDWKPPSSLREWIGLARPGDGRFRTAEGKTPRLQRIHQKHVERKGE